jgi:hypothetical protein
MVVFYAPAVIMDGGFIFGFILGIIGGKATFSEKVEAQSTNPKTRV